MVTNVGYSFDSSVYANPDREVLKARLQRLKSELSKVDPDDENEDVYRIRWAIEHDEAILASEDRSEAEWVEAWKRDVEAYSQSKTLPNHHNSPISRKQIHRWVVDGFREFCDRGIDYVAELEGQYVLVGDSREKRRIASILEEIDRYIDDRRLSYPSIAKANLDEIPEAESAYTDRKGKSDWMGKLLSRDKWENLGDEKNKSKSDFAPLSIGELSSKNPTRRPSLIDGLLRVGETMNIIASPKTGKTWLAANLAFSIASGAEWLGRQCKRGMVLVFDCELHAEEIAYRYGTVAKAMGVGLDGVYVQPLRGSGKTLSELRTMLKSNRSQKFDAIVFDALYRLLPKGTSENDNQQMMMVYNLIDEIASETGASQIVIHHTSKGNQAERGVTDIGAGAGSISRAADVHLTIRPHEIASCAVLEGVSRSFEGIDPQTIRWEFPLWVPSEIEPEVKGGKKDRKSIQNENDTAAKLEVLSVLNSHGRPMVQSKLAERLSFGSSVSRFKRILAMMANQDRTIKKTSKKRKGSRQTVVVWESIS